LTIFCKDNTWWKACGQKDLIHDETSDTTITVFKRMNLLKSQMKIKSGLQGENGISFALIGMNKLSQFIFYFLGRHSSVIIDDDGDFFESARILGTIFL
jgi:hypothetical protein